MSPVSLAEAAQRHPLPEPWTPQAGRGWRRALSEEVEASLLELWGRATAAVGLQDDDAAASAPSLPGVALACVGSLARREAGPASDLDLVLLHDPRASHLDAAAVASLAEHLWYPLWDAGIQLDHSVRTIDECRTVASKDLAAALGLLDLRHLAGDESLTSACAPALLTDWRRATRHRLGELADESRRRAESAGDLAGLLEPDLKEAHGGLRDAVLVRALAASSLADRPHGAFDAAVDTLLGVRDALALTTGRATNRLVLASQDEVAVRLGLGSGPDDDERPGDRLLALVYEAAREVGAALDATMRSALRAARPARRPLTIVRFGRRSAPVLARLDDGVAVLDGEVVIAEGARPSQDAALPLRLALAAARSHQPIAAPTRAGLGRCPAPVAPWSSAPVGRADGAARPSAVGSGSLGGSGGEPGEAGTDASSALDLFIDLLSTGRALPRVWEDLDLAGLPSRWLPGWERIRNRPQHNPVHLWTVDRHAVRTAAVMADLLEDPEMPGRMRDARLVPPGRGSRDPERRVLLLAALLHDLGKVPGAPGTDHAVTGAALLGPVLDTLGVPEEERTGIEVLVRHHLLLSEAAGQAPGAFEAVRDVRAALGEGPVALWRLSALRLLTEADARAAGPRAWSGWRAELIDRSTSALAAALR